MKGFPKRWIRGTELDRREVRVILMSFCHRNTVENLRRHPQVARILGTTLPPIRDREWLAVTEFPATKRGQWDQRYDHCLTHHEEVPAWASLIKSWANKQNERNGEQYEQ